LAIRQKNGRVLITAGTRVWQRFVLMHFREFVQAARDNDHKPDAIRPAKTRKWTSIPYHS
jgi:hypothetical protein